MKGDPAYVGMEIQILDDHWYKDNKNYKGLRPTQLTGAIYDVVPPREDATKPAGEWNQMQITAKGRHVIVVLNSTKIVDANLDDYKNLANRHPGLLREKGHLGLQSHDGRVEFRKIEIKELAKKGDIEVIFLGDSITDAWGGEGHNEKSNGGEIFEKEFKPLKTANFGIRGARTQHILWGLQHGVLEGIHPRIVMLMIGTNNIGDNTAQEIADDITAIVKEIHKSSPATKILLLGIFPRGEKPAPVRDKIKGVNVIISRLDDGGKTVKYLDISDMFVQPDGTISRQIMFDYLHLTPKGYQTWGDAVKGPINELLGKK